MTKRKKAAFVPFQSKFDFVSFEHWLHKAYKMPAGLSILRLALAGLSSVSLSIIRAVAFKALHVT